MKRENRVIIDVDEEYHIEVDTWNWIVIETHEATKGDNVGEMVDVEVAYCHDLAHALKAIVKLKTERDVPRQSIEDYLTKVDSSYAWMVKAVSEQRAGLIEAMEMNKVM